MAERISSSSSVYDSDYDIYGPTEVASSAVIPKEPSLVDTADKTIQVSESVKYFQGQLTDYIRVAEKVSEVLDSFDGNPFEILSALGKASAHIDLPDRKTPYTIGGKSDCSLSINFGANNLETLFNDQKQVVKLSNAMGIIRDLNEIFSKVHTAQGSHSVRALEQQLEQAVVSKSDAQLIVDGKPVVSFYPDNQRVVFSTSRGQSSLPLAMLGNCTHLYQKKFAERICILMGRESYVNSLLTSVRLAYIGRCLMGVAQSAHSRIVQNVGSQREFFRLVVLLTWEQSVHKIRQVSWVSFFQGDFLIIPFSQRDN